MDETDFLAWSIHFRLMSKEDARAKWKLLLADPNHPGEGDGDDRQLYIQTEEVADQRCGALRGWQRDRALKTYEGLEGGGRRRPQAVSRAVGQRPQLGLFARTNWRGLWQI